MSSEHTEIYHRLNEGDKERAVIGEKVERHEGCLAWTKRVLNGDEDSDGLRTRVRTSEDQLKRIVFWMRWAVGGLGVLIAERIFDRIAGG